MMLKKLFISRIGVSSLGCLSIQHSLDRILYTFQWGDLILLENGQEAYKIVKCFEAICTSVLIEKKTERICDNRRFWEGIKSDLEKISDLN